MVHKILEEHGGERLTRNMVEKVARLHLQCVPYAAAGVVHGTDNATSNPYLSKDDTQWHASDDFLEALFNVIPQGELHLDAASDEVANERVGAARIITVEQDGVNPATAWGTMEEPLNVFLNAPGGTHPTRRTKLGGSNSLQGLFLERAIEEHEAGAIHQNIVIHLRAAVGHVWFRLVYGLAHCWLDRHVKFLCPNREYTGSASMHGSVVVFMGGDEGLARFCASFGEIGHIPGYQRTWCLRNCLVLELKKEKGKGWTIISRVGQEGQMDRKPHRLCEN